MNKIPNGNWEDDKEICYKALLNGYDVSEVLEIIYKYGFEDGRQKEINKVLEILKGVKHE